MKKLVLTAIVATCAASVFAQGTVTFTPIDPNGVTASGHFAEWHGVSVNNRNEVVTDTSTFQLWGTDGPGSGNGARSVRRCAQHANGAYG